MNEPLVTVIATCYNHARFLAECLESIRHQTYPNIELIIADDFSTDDSVERILAWVAQHGIDCRLLLHDRNQGVCRTLNDALLIATGKYVAMVSTDDVWFPEKTARQVAMMERLPESVGLVYSDAYLIDETGRRLPGTALDTFSRFSPPPEGDVFELLLQSVGVAPMTTLIRRSCLTAAGPYDESLVYEDWDMWLRIARHYHFIFDPTPGANYRILPKSLSRCHQAEILRSNIRILTKWHSEPRTISLVQKGIAAHYWGLSQLEPQNRWHSARLALRHDRGFLAFAKLLCLVFGIRFERIRHWSARLASWLPKRSALQAKLLAIRGPRGWSEPLPPASSPTGLRLRR